MQTLNNNTLEKKKGKIFAASNESSTNVTHYYMTRSATSSWSKKLNFLGQPRMASEDVTLSLHLWNE